MDESRNDIQKCIRRLRKKLRQIERLERVATLTEEESFKIRQKGELRCELKSLLVSLPSVYDSTGDCDFSNHSESNGGDKLYKEINHEPSDNLLPPENNVKVAVHLTSNDDAFVQCQETRATDSSSKTSVTPVKENDEMPKEAEHVVTELCSKALEVCLKDDAPPLDSPDLHQKPNLKLPEFKENREIQKDRDPRSSTRSKQSVDRPKYTVSEMDEPIDMIFTVFLTSEYVLCAGRDTQINVYHGKTNRKTLLGHKKTITCCAVLDNRIAKNGPVVVTGSLDCHLKYWDLTTGEALKSQYTYNPIYCLEYMKSLDSLLLGTTGGKIEIWDCNLTSGEGDGGNLARHSVVAHATCVTSLKHRISDSTIICVSGSEDGEIKVWTCQLSDGGASLKNIYVSDNIKHTRSSRCITIRTIHSLCMDASNYIFVADGGQKVKVIHWPSGELVFKIRVFRESECGSVDSVLLLEESGSSSLLVCATYFLDTGISKLLVFRMKSDPVSVDYLMSVGAGECTGIIKDMSGTVSRRGEGGSTELHLVTGGNQLKLWTINLPTTTRSNTPSPMCYSGDSSCTDEDEDEEDDTSVVCDDHKQVVSPTWHNYCSLL